MDNNFFREMIPLKNDEHNDFNRVNSFVIKDSLVNDFLNKNISLEALIEKEINFNAKN